MQEDSKRHLEEDDSGRQQSWLFQTLRSLNQGFPSAHPRTSFANLSSLSLRFSEMKGWDLKDPFQFPFFLLIKKWWQPQNEDMSIKVLNVLS